MKKNLEIKEGIKIPWWSILGDELPFSPANIIILLLLLAPLLQLIRSEKLNNLSCRLVDFLGNLLADFFCCWKSYTLWNFSAALRSSCCCCCFCCCFWLWWRNSCFEDSLNKLSCVFKIHLQQKLNLDILFSSSEILFKTVYPYVTMSFCLFVMVFHLIDL